MIMIDRSEVLTSQNFCNSILRYVALLTLLLYGETSLKHVTNNAIKSISLIDSQYYCTSLLSIAFD